MENYFSTRKNETKERLLTENLNYEKKSFTLKLCLDQNINPKLLFKCQNKISYAYDFATEMFENKIYN